MFGVVAQHLPFSMTVTFNTKFSSSSNHPPPLIRAARLCSERGSNELLAYNIKALSVTPTILLPRRRHVPRLPASHSQENLREWF